MDFSLQTLEASGVPINIPQLISQDILSSACGVGSGDSGGKICVILFVPHIYDSTAKYRQNYIDTISEVSKSFRSAPFSFLWSEGGNHIELENILNINSAYPTLAVLSLEKKVFALQKLSWSSKNAKAFLNGVISGRYDVLNMLFVYLFICLFVYLFICYHFFFNFIYLLFVPPLLLFFISFFS